jgi:hypothetical protein
MGFLDELLELGEGLRLEAGLDQPAVGVEEHPVGVRLVVPGSLTVGVVDTRSLRVGYDGEGEVVVSDDLAGLGWALPENVDPDDCEFVFRVSVEAFERRVDVGGDAAGAAAVAEEEDECGFAAEVADLKAAAIE